MPAIIDNRDTIYLGGQFQSKSGYVVVDKYSKPAAAGTDDLLALTACPALGTTLVTTFAAQPDVPRVVTIKGNQASVVGNVVVTGLDARGNVVIDTIATNADNAVDGVIAFAKLTSVKIPTRGAPGDQISVGSGADLGLSKIPEGDSGIAETSGGVAEASIASLTTNAAYAKNVFTPVTSSDGNTDKMIAYISTELFGKVG